MLRRPFRYVRMKAFAVPYDWREQKKVAALLQFRLESGGELIAGLGFHRDIAARTVLDSEARIEQADEMVNLRHRRDGAFAATARIALLDADGRWNSRNEIDVRPGKLFHKLPGV